MQTLDALSHIRAHPEMYLRGGRPDRVEMARQLAGDAVYLGAKRVQIIDVNGWMLIAADSDWLCRSSGDLHTLFHEVVAFPEAGINAMRSEVLLTAFADDVFTADATGHTVIKGSAPADADVYRAAKVENWARVVAFRLPSTN